MEKPKKMPNTYFNLEFQSKNSGRMFEPAAISIVHSSYCNFSSLVLFFSPPVFFVAFLKELNWMMVTFSNPYWNRKFGYRNVCIFVSFSLTFTSYILRSYPFDSNAFFYTQCHSFPFLFFLFVAQIYITHYISHKFTGIKVKGKKRTGKSEVEAEEEWKRPGNKLNKENNDCLSFETLSNQLLKLRTMWARYQFIGRE